MQTLNDSRTLQKPCRRHRNCSSGELVGALGLAATRSDDVKQLEGAAMATAKDGRPRGPGVQEQNARAGGGIIAAETLCFPADYKQRNFYFSTFPLFFFGGGGG